MKRYQKYLNKSLFITQDEFLKRKYKSYMALRGTVKGETFFERMHKDTKLRQEKEKLRVHFSKHGVHSDVFSQKDSDTESQLSVSRVGFRVSKALQ